MQAYKYMLSLLLCSLIHTSYSMHYRRLQPTNSKASEYIEQSLKEAKLFCPEEIAHTVEYLLTNISANKPSKKIEDLIKKETLNKLYYDVYNNCPDLYKKQSYTPIIQKFTIIEDYQQEDV